MNDVKYVLIYKTQKKKRNHFIMHLVSEKNEKKSCETSLRCH